MARLGTNNIPVGPIWKLLCWLGCSHSMRMAVHSNQYRKLENSAEPTWLVKSRAHPKDFTQVVRWRCCQSGRGGRSTALLISHVGLRFSLPDGSSYFQLIRCETFSLSVRVATLIHEISGRVFFGRWVNAIRPLKPLTFSKGIN